MDLDVKEWSEDIARAKEKAQSRVIERFRSAEKW